MAAPLFGSCCFDGQLIFAIGVRTSWEVRFSEERCGIAKFDVATNTERDGVTG